MVAAAGAAGKDADAGAAAAGGTGMGICPAMGAKFAPGEGTGGAGKEGDMDRERAGKGAEKKGQVCQENVGSASLCLWTVFLKRSKKIWSENLAKI